MPASYLLDTHALVGWVTKTSMSESFVSELDKLHLHRRVLASSVSFWEIALLAKRGRLVMDDIGAWKQGLVARGLPILDPTADQMIASVSLPDIHKDPFDRLLIAQASSLGVTLVTRDRLMGRYGVDVMWDR